MSTAATPRPASVDAASPWDDPERIEHEARLIIFRRLAERMPAGHVFRDVVELTLWCLEEGERHYGPPSPRFRERALRVAAQMWAAISEAEAFNTPHGPMLLDVAIRAQRTYRREGYVHA